MEGKHHKGNNGFIVYSKTFNVLPDTSTTEATIPITPSYPYCYAVCSISTGPFSLSLSLSPFAHTLCHFWCINTSLKKLPLRCDFHRFCLSHSCAHWVFIVCWLLPIIPSTLAVELHWYAHRTILWSDTPAPRILVISKHSVRTHHPSKREQKCSISSIIHRRHLCAPPTSGSARPLMGMEEPSLSPPLTIAHQTSSSLSASSKLSSTFCLFVVSFQATIQCVRAFKRIMNHCFVAMSAT